MNSGGIWATEGPVVSEKSLSGCHSQICICLFPFVPSFQATDSESGSDILDEVLIMLNCVEKVERAGRLCLQRNRSILSVEKNFKEVQGPLPCSGDERCE